MVAKSLSALKIAVKSGDKEKVLFWADKSILETRELISSLRMDLEEDFVLLVKDYEKTFENNFCIKTCVFDATNFAEIKLLNSGNDFIMSISDNGKGFDTAQPKSFDFAQPKCFYAECVRDSSTCEAVPKFRRFYSEAEN